MLHLHPNIFTQMAKFFSILLFSLVLCSCTSSYSPSDIVDDIERREYAIVRHDTCAQRNWDESMDNLKNLDEAYQTEERMFMAILVAGLIAAAIYAAGNRKRTQRKIQYKLDQLAAELADKINLLEVQKEQFRLTNNRISESITYALRIQHSILPDPELLRTYPITGAFIFYSPLDIVSGDFYWFVRKNDNLIICCADCTGHGVPGAFMSMIASTIINDICSSAPDDISPSAILEELDVRLLQALSHNTGEDAASKDGLDTCIANINMTTQEVAMAGARRPVLVYTGGEMINVKTTKRSIGETEPKFRARPFEDTVLQLNKGDKFYMFSDGYSDQLGGPNKEKLKVSRITEMLDRINTFDLDEQYIEVQDMFIQWQGEGHQTDDVLFMGVKV